MPPWPWQRTQFASRIGLTSIAYDGDVGISGGLVSHAAAASVHRPMSLESAVMTSQVVVKLQHAEQRVRVVGPSQRLVTEDAHELEVGPREEVYLQVVSVAGRVLDRQVLLEALVEQADHRPGQREHRRPGVRHQLVLSV